MITQTVVLDWYEDIIDHFSDTEKARETLESLITGAHKAMGNDRYYFIERHYESEVRYGDKTFVIRDARETEEWNELLDTIWNLHDLDDYAFIFVWVSW